MEGYHAPEIRPEDAAEAENVFLSVTSDGALYRGAVKALRDRIRRNAARDFVIRSQCLGIANGKANELERDGLCTGPISYLARAIAAMWLESYYRDHVAEGG